MHILSAGIPVCGNPGTPTSYMGPFCEECTQAVTAEDNPPPLTPHRHERQRAYAMRVLFDDLMPHLDHQATIPWRVADRVAQRYGCEHYTISPEGIREVSTASVALTIARYMMRKRRARR